jgi:hypothetical protein
MQGELSDHPKLNIKKEDLCIHMMPKDGPNMQYSILVHGLYCDYSDIATTEHK